MPASPSVADSNKTAVRVVSILRSKGPPSAGSVGAVYDRAFFLASIQIGAVIDRAYSCRNLNRQDFLFFLFGDFFEFADVIVCEFLNFGKAILLVVFRDRFVLEHFLQV